MAKRKPKKKTKKAVIKTLLTLGIVICIILLAVTGLIAGSLFGYVEDADLIDVDNMRLNLTSFVYAVDPDTGEEIELEKLYDTENRVWASSKEIPEHLKNAFVAIEDERFYKHSGFDIKRFTGAAIQYVSAKISGDGRSSYGGSTITQQLIKNITKDDDYSIKRKIQEIYRAYNLEKQLSKDEILEYYLNTIYLSQKCNGVSSAAQTYFGKDVSELSLAECATIAAITKYPTKYDPVKNPQNNKERQLVVLKKMLELGFVTKSEYESAVAEEIKILKKDASQEEEFQSYFTDAAIDQVINDLMTTYGYSKEYASKVLYNGGLRIYLSIDTRIQEILDRVYNDDSTFQRTSKAVQPQSSMVIMDPYTGEVKALIGGRGAKEGNRTLNRATQTLRQPGSSIKPLAVYSPAVEYGLVTPSSIVNDSPITMGDWSPRNDDRRFAGRITVAAALRGSRNVPAVKICNYLTTEAAFSFVQNNYHISTLVDRRKSGDTVLSDKGPAAIALGGLTDGVSVLEMCAAYCAFPNGGKYIKPTTYTRVEDSEGNIVLEHKNKAHIAISETTARTMVKMLTDAVNGGTGTSARLSNMPVAGKTGTTSNNNDRWFVGFTPYYVGAVWFGYDQPSSLRGFSANPAAVAWRKVMQEVHKDLERKSFFFNNSESELSMMICADSGMKCTPACTRLISKDFKKKDVPKKYCTTHGYEYNENDLEEGLGPIDTNEEKEAIVTDDEGALQNPDENTPSTSNPNETTTPDTPTPPPVSPSPEPQGGSEGIVIE